MLNILVSFNTFGYGDWGLGIGDWAQSPIPNPQSPNFIADYKYYIMYYILSIIIYKLFFYKY